MLRCCCGYAAAIFLPAVGWHSNDNIGSEYSKNGNDRGCNENGNTYNGSMLLLLS